MWIYENKELSESDIGDNIGFVYLITHKETQQKYIGRKGFSVAGYKQIKGKRKKIRKPSDWQNYYSSSTELQDMVKQQGADKFERTVLRMCKTIGELKYWENKLQFAYNVLEKRLPDGTFEFLNGNIAMKHTRRNIGVIQ